MLVCCGLGAGPAITCRDCIWVVGLRAERAWQAGAEDVERVCDEHRAEQHGLVCEAHNARTKVVQRGIA